jgi:hypothetical protein
MFRLQHKEKGVWKTMVKGKDWEYSGKNLLLLSPLKKKLPKKTVLITKKQWSKLKFGSILKSKGGLLRKNVSKRTPTGAVIFKKLNKSGYPGDETAYTYNDICKSYKIVKY